MKNAEITFRKNWTFPLIVAVIGLAFSIDLLWRLINGSSVPVEGTEWLLLLLSCYFFWRFFSDYRLNRAVFNWSEDTLKIFYNGKELYQGGYDAVTVTELDEQKVKLKVPSMKRELLLPMGNVTADLHGLFSQLQPK